MLAIEGKTKRKGDRGGKDIKVCFFMQVGSVMESDKT
jgi:hypothetical protein